MLVIRFEVEPPERPRTPRAERGRLGRLGTPAIVLGILAAILLTGVAVSQTGPSSRSSIHACVDRDSRAVRIVGSGRKCRRGEQRVRWARIGPVGDRGPAGAPGAPGAPGANGVAG
ncbi:MAG TPA: hypothetical protein VF587_00775, partial [Solirubrobacteraceae bacterium]